MALRNLKNVEPTGPHHLPVEVWKSLGRTGVSFLKEYYQQPLSILRGIIYNVSLHPAYANDIHAKFHISHSSCAEQYGAMSADPHTHTYTHTQINHQWLVYN